jgi:hypothetical protein
MEKDKYTKIYLGNKDGSLKPHKWFTSEQLDKSTGLVNGKYYVAITDTLNDYIRSIPCMGRKIKTTRFKLMILEVELIC